MKIGLRKVYLLLKLGSSVRFLINLREYIYNIILFNINKIVEKYVKEKRLIDIHRQCKDF